MKIAIYYIATSVYKNYFTGFYNSLDNFFPGIEKKIILFTDDKENKYLDKYDIEWHYINHYPWPIVSMYKMYRILENLDESYDYHFHFNSNVIFKENNDYTDLINKLQTNKLLLVTHWNNTPYYNEFNNNLRYIHGGLWGGCTQIIKQMCKEHTEILNNYINNEHYVPAWHDETVLNEWYSKNSNKAISFDIHQYIDLLNKDTFFKSFEEKIKIL